MTAKQEWQAHWPLVLAATIGFSFYSVAIYSIGLFIAPLNAEFGWSRTEVTGGLSLAAIISAPFAPIVGAIIDRRGARKLALPGIVATTLALAAFGLVNNSVTVWMALWVIYAFISLSIKSTVWTVAVSGIFNSGRSMALACTVAGVALAQTLAPPLTQMLIASFGWREAFFILALGWGSIAFITNVFFLFDAHDRQITLATKLEKEDSVPVLAGLGLSVSITNPALLKIAASTTLSMFFGVALLIHQVPIMTDGGLARSDAAWLASLSGIAGFIGKLVTGWLMDRYSSGWVPATTLAAAAVGFFILLDQFRTPMLTVMAMIIIGYSTGAKFQICAYLTSRHAGIKNFGKIFGTLSILIVLASGIGPVAAGAVFDLYGKYELFLIAAIPSCLISGYLVLRLGPSPDWESRTADAEKSD